MQNGPHLVIEQRLVMASFCWAYTDALLKKLRELDEQDQIFRDGGNAALHNENSGCASHLTALAYSVVDSIGQQISWEKYSSTMKPSDVAALIDGCQEFLDIFKTEKAADQLKGEIAAYIVDFTSGHPRSHEAAHHIVYDLLHAKYNFL